MGLALSPAADRIPHAAEVLAAVAEARRAIRDAQTEVIPFGPGYRACADAATALESLARYLDETPRLGDPGPERGACDGIPPLPG